MTSDTTKNNWTKKGVCTNNCLEWWALRWEAMQGTSGQSYEIKSPPWTILWFRILGIFSVENIARLGVFML